MAETVRFEINLPEELALKYADGLNVDGRYGPQTMFTLTDERKIYVPPFVGDQISDMRLQPGERFEIVKRSVKNGRKTGVEWQVSRVDPPMTAVPARAPIAAAAPAVPVSVPSTNRENLAHMNAQQNGPNYPHANGVPARAQQSSVPSPTPNTLSDFIMYNTTVLTGFLCASIDALDNATKYAATKGVKLEFNEEDVRTCANNFFGSYARQQQQGRYAA